MQHVQGEVARPRPSASAGFFAGGCSAARIRHCVRLDGADVELGRNAASELWGATACNGTGKFAYRLLQAQAQVSARHPTLYGIAEATPVPHSPRPNRRAP